MKTWNDYKEYVKETNPESRKIMEEAEMLSSIVSTVIRQCDGNFQEEAYRHWD